MTASAPANKPTNAPSLSVETHGIQPVPDDRRYGRPRRLFTVWFAPNLTVSGVFTGALAITLGLDFVAALSAILIGTIAGAVITAYLGTFGPRTGSGQLPFARLPFGRSVLVPGILAWGSAVAWDGLVGIFGGQALQALTNLPFWLSICIVLALQALVGFFGYELIHRFQIVMSVVLGAAFILLSFGIVGHATIQWTGTVQGESAVGAWILMLSISFSLSISWAPYASDFSRYLPASSPPRRVWCATTLGISASYIWVQLIGASGASALTDQTALGISNLLGGGIVGTIGLCALVLAVISSNAMNDYSGSLSLQTIGVRIPRPIAALIVAACALALVLWMNDGDLIARFESVLLLVSYWIPGFVAIVVIDWIGRKKADDGSVDVDRALQHQHSGWRALVALLIGIACTIPFMNTTIWQGPLSVLFNGADLAYFVGMVGSGMSYIVLRSAVPHRANASMSRGDFGERDEVRPEFA